MVLCTTQTWINQVGFHRRIFRFRREEKRGVENKEPFDVNDSKVKGRDRNDRWGSGVVSFGLEEKIKNLTR